MPKTYPPFTETIAGSLPACQLVSDIRGEVADMPTLYNKVPVILTNDIAWFRSYEELTAFSNDYLGGRTNQKLSDADYFVFGRPALIASKRVWAELLLEVLAGAADYETFNTRRELHATPKLYDEARHRAGNAVGWEG
jgi:hypothetical protein